MSNETAFFIASVALFSTGHWIGGLVVGCVFAAFLIGEYLP